MRIGVKVLFFGAVLGIASLCFGSEWEDFVGAEKVKLLNSIEDVPPLFFVSLDGNDEWSGRLDKPNSDRTDGPFRSFEKARTALRDYRASSEFNGKPTLVEVLPGIYEIDSPFTFSLEDSGTAESPVIWRGVKGADGKPSTVLRGGRILTGIKPVTDEAILRRVKPEVQDKMVQIDLRTLGITEFGSPDGQNMAEIFLNDEPLTPSRFPNEGFLHIEELVLEGNKEIQDHDNKGVAEGKFIVREDADFAAWQNEPDPWVSGYWFWDWASGRQKIAKIDTDKKYLELEAPPHNFGYRKGQYFYAYNLLCEVDMPGEYYIDRQTGILYLYPPEGFEEGVLTMSIIPTLLQGTDLSHTVFYGFRFDACRAAGVTLSGNDLLVARSVFCDIGGYGMQLSGDRNLLFGSLFYNTGQGGVLFATGDTNALVDGKSAMVNNDIHHFGRIARVYTPAFRFHACGGMTANNRITDAPHCGILYGGNENQIILNEIANVCQESNDAGAVYCGGCWFHRGNLIKNNYLHDIRGFRDRGAVGVYLDDMFSGTDIIGNYFVNVTRAAMIGGGRDCSIQNNIFVECYPNFHVDARALGWAHKTGAKWEEEARQTGKIYNIDYKSELWSRKYPKLSSILDGTPCAPEGDIVARNLVIREEWESEEPGAFDDTNSRDTTIEEAARPYITIENNLIGNPAFLEKVMNADDGLIPNTEIPFERVPLERIGIFEHPAAVSR